MKKQTNTVRFLTLSILLTAMACFTGCPSGETPDPVTPDPPRTGTSVSVSVAPDRAVLGVGESLQLQASSVGGKKEGYIWSSSNPSVATVDQSGKVTGVAGSSSEVTITATGNKSKKGAKSRVVVAQVTVTSSGEPMAIGGSEKLSAVSTYSGDTSFTWTSSNTNVATVATDGTVTAVSTGTASVRATASTSRASNSANVTVAKVTISYSGEPLFIGGTEQFNVSSTYSGDTSFTWQSSNSNIVSVSANGTVTAVALGSVTITATGNGSGFSDSEQVTVIPAVSSMLIWDGEVSFAGTYGSLNGAHSFRGSGCFEGTPDPWHSPLIQLDGLSSYAADISAYDEIWFFAKSNMTGKSFSLSFRCWPTVSNSISIDPYIQGGALDTTWRLVRVPVAALKTATYTLNKIESVSFGKAVPSAGHKIYVDEMWAVNLSSIDPANAPLVGELPSLAFSDVVLGASAQKSITVRNMGTADLVVSGMSMTSDPRGEFSVDGTAFTVAPGESHDVKVTFSPKVSGSKLTKLVLAHNMTPLGAVTRTSIVGSAVGPTISLSPASLSFGGIPQGQQASLSLTIRNVGNAVLQVTSIQSSNGSFLVPSGALSIQPSAQQTVAVTFAPNSATAQSGVLQVNSNDPFFSQRTVSLSGTGLTSGSTADLDLHVDDQSSTSISLRWPQLQSASQVRIYIGPEPSPTGQGPLPVQQLVDTISSPQEYTLEGLAPAVDTFVYLQALNASQQVTGEGHAHVRLPGGPMAQLDSAVRNVHLYAPNVVMLVMADLRVYSFSTQSDVRDQGIDELQGYHGVEWQTGPWTVTRANGASINVSDVARRSVPVGQNYYETGFAATTADNQLNVDHSIFLILDAPVGSRDILHITGPLGTDVVVPVSDKYLETPVIQVNQVGYSPNATERYAYVSGWMGDGGPLSLSGFPAKANVLVEPKNPLAQRNSALSNVTIANRTASGTLDTDSGTEVKEIDLSALPASEGTVYRVQIPGVGVSWPTQVSEAAVQKAYYTIARGLYLNRWGRDLQPEWTEWSPRPADHSTVYTAETTDPLLKQPEDAPLTGQRPLVGGHHDAGDFDIRMFHYVVPMVLMRCFEMNGAALTDGQLTIPESQNGIPDILDEALWSIAAWEQLQEADGGVRMGVESYRHPWGIYYADEDPLPYWTYARDPIHTARIAGLFAQASRLVAPYDSAKAQELATRSVSAYSYALANGVEISIGGPLMYAASELAGLTGSSSYVEQFEAGWLLYDKYGDGPNIHATFPWRGSYDSANQPIIVDFIMGYTESPYANQTYRAQAIDRLRALGETKIAIVNSSHAHRNPRNDSATPDWGQGTAMGEFLLPVYALLQSGSLNAEEEQAYYNILSLSADYVLGCNPAGMAWVTGLGTRSPIDPLHLDALSFKKDGYGVLPGIPIYGPVANLQELEYNQYAENCMYPVLASTPLLRRYADVHGLVQMNEFDVSLSATHTELFGALLAPGFEPPASWLPFGGEHSSTLPPRS